MGGKYFHVKNLDCQYFIMIVQNHDKITYLMTNLHDQVKKSKCMHFRDHRLSIVGILTFMSRINY